MPLRITQAGGRRVAQDGGSGRLLQAPVPSDGTSYTDPTPVPGPAIDPGPAGDPWLTGGDGVPAVRPATPLGVYRYDPAYGTYDPLPALVPTVIDQSIGADPGSCRLRYRLGAAIDGAPQSMEEALDTGFNLPGALNPGDRVSVWAQDRAGVPRPAFDGFAVGFELVLDAGTEQVEVACVGVAKRAWDAPVGGAIYRDGSDPLGHTDVATEEVAHFNPRGIGNRIAYLAADADNGDPDQSYPTFIDPDNRRYDAAEEPENAPRLWTFADAARYLIYTGNRDEFYVKSPKGDDLDATLVAKVPREPVDESDEVKYDSKPLEVPDLPVTGKGWPTALLDIISTRGFTTAWELDDEDGAPVTRLEVFDPQAREPKDVYLQPRGSTLDLALTNLASAHAGRDVTEVVNRWEVHGELEEWEVSVILACGFAVESGDAGRANDFDLAKNHGFRDNPDDYNKYRLYIYDESGEGHYPYDAGGGVDHAPGSLDGVLGSPETVAGADVPRYATRRRRPLGELLTHDGNDRPMKAKLSISTDYEGAAPALWDGTGTWQEVGGGFQLLKDRIGVYVDCQSPNAWKIADKAPPGSGSAAVPFPGGVVRAVDALATPAAAVAGVEQQKKFMLRLTCVIRGDKRLKGIATQPGAEAVLPQEVTRVVDAHDRYKKQIISLWSEFAPANESSRAEVVVRDDEELAKAEAAAALVATQSGVFGGELVIPYYTRAYKVGDRIRSIQGRSLGFRTGGGDSAPVYPVVTRVTHQLLDRQVTVLGLSDASAARSSYTRNLGGKKAFGGQRGVRRRGR